MTEHRRPRGEGHLRRHELLDAAEAMLEDGLSEDDISVSSIVGAVGLTQPVLYRFFADKSALFTEVYRRRFADFGNRIEAAAAAGSGPRDRLVRRGCAYVRIAVEQPDAYRRLFMDPNGIAAAVYRSPAGHTESDRAPEGERSAFDDLVDNVTALTTQEPHPRFASDTDLARAIWALVHGIASLAITIDDWDDGDLDTLTAAAITSLLDESQPPQN